MIEMKAMKVILLALVAAILLACLTGCEDPVKKVKKELQEAKEDFQQAKESLDTARQATRELRDRDSCLNTTLTEGNSDACPGAGD